jgi:hypothetical protein
MSKGTDCLSAPPDPAPTRPKPEVLTHFSVFQLSVLQLSSIHRGRTELASHDSRVVSSRGGGPTNIIETSRVASSRGGGPTNIIETRRRERKAPPHG